MAFNVLNKNAAFKTGFCGQWTKRVLTRKIIFVHDFLTLFCCSRVNGWKRSFLKTIMSAWCIRLGRRCCLRVICLWGDRDGLIIRRCLFPFQWFIHRNSSWLSKDDGKSIRWPHFSCNNWASSRRGSRIHTDGFPKRASTKAHASRGVWKGWSPGKFLKFFTPSSSLWVLLWFLEAITWGVRAQIS